MILIFGMSTFVVGLGAGLIIGAYLMTLGRIR